MIKRFISHLKCGLYYILGNIFSIFFFDRKYLTGRYFTGKWGGVASIGWEWTFKSGLAKLCGCNKCVKWPVAGRITVTYPENIEFSLNDLHIFQTYGTYFQAINAKIIIGEGSWVAPNVGIITANHDIYDLNKHMPGKDIVIGKKCWIGMNSVILSGVHFGNYTIVGAGSVVTKSFPEGNCVISGNPARIIKQIER